MKLQLKTLIDLAVYNKQHAPDKTAYTFLNDGETETDQLTYEALDQKARTIAAYLQTKGQPGDRVLLLYPASLDYITAFFGCLYAGMIAVPAYPPHPKRPLHRLTAIAKNCQPTLYLTTQALITKLEARFAQNPSLKHLVGLATDTLDLEQSPLWQPPSLTADTLAFLQYTSGSTGQPKGAMISHGNLLYNQQMIAAAFGHSEETIFAGWLPMFHDMGLVGNVLQPFYLGIPCILMPPTAFLQKPIRWLQIISRYRATTSGGPNFGYDLCVQKIREDQLAELDLSSWQVAFNGAEPIRAKTITEFTDKFAACGFQHTTHYPFYGLAEASLFVSGGVSTTKPRLYEIDKKALNDNIIQPASGPQTRQLVSSGQNWLDQQILIVDPEATTVCADGQIGEIWLAGSHVGQGYWRQPEATESTFQAYVSEGNIHVDRGPYLRTGDLGFFKSGQLFVCGRLKDMIIIRGQNHYPQDIELTVEQCHPALQTTAGAAFSIMVDGLEQLVIVHEVKRTALKNLDRAALNMAIRRAVSQTHDLQVSDIVLIKPTTIPKTSSGKIQRQACKTLYLNNELQLIGVKQAPKSASMTEGNPSMNEHLVSEQSHQQANQLIDWLRHYANSRINSRLIDERRTIPPYVVLDFGNQGLLGMQIPETFGGLGLSNRDTLRVFEQLAAIDLTLTLFVGNHHVLGTRPIQKYAQPAIQNEHLPLIAQGRQIASFALTEPGAGSNPRAISASATPTPDGRWCLNGEKIWIGSGAWAGIINIFVQQLDEKQQPQGVTGFAVPQGTPGLIQGPEAITMGMRGMVQNSIYLKDVLVGPENLLSEPGQGMAVAQDAMMFGRMGLGIMSVGGLKRCAQLMLHYASQRTVSSGRLLDNPITLQRLGDLTAITTALETLTLKLADLLDQGQVIADEALMACKILGPEFLWQTADNLVQLLGGRGAVETNMAPQLLRDARLLRIFEGPTETLTTFLGTTITNNPNALYHFLQHQLGAATIAQRLEQAIGEIKERQKQLTAAFPNQPANTRWTHFLIGDVAACAILHAAVKGDLADQSNRQIAHATEWTKQFFEQKVKLISLLGSPIFI
ncbi:MAG: AMP-binding protein, partial [Chloroflexota bacterium]